MNSAVIFAKLKNTAFELKGRINKTKEIKCKKLYFISFFIKVFRRISIQLLPTMSTRTEKKISTKVSNTIQKKDNGDVKKKTRKRVVVSYEKSDPPVGWETTYKLIKQQRERVKAPVDEMGCSQLAEKEISPKLKRYQTLIYCISIIE